MSPGLSDQPASLAKRVHVTRPLVVCHQHDHVRAPVRVRFLGLRHSRETDRGGRHGEGDRALHDPILRKIASEPR